MDFGIGSSYDHNHYAHVDHLNPFEQTNNDNNLFIQDDGLSVNDKQTIMTTQDSSCRQGAEIILKRIVKKLFNQMNELQPSELDDEFLYQSSLSYEDYLNLLKQSQSDKEPFNCASLNRIENVLSKLMSTASMRRPIQTNLFSDLIHQSPSFYDTSSLINSGLIGGATSTHMFFILLVVCLTAWVFSNICRLSWYKSWPTSLFIVGFVEFCMFSMNQLNVDHRLNLERCANPTMFDKLASWFIHDYNNCLSGHPKKPNIAHEFIRYNSNLLFSTFSGLSEFGESINKYLNSFSGFNYLLGVVVLLMVVAQLPYYLFSGLAHVVQSSRGTSRARSTSPTKRISIQGSPRGKLESAKKATK